MRRLIALLLLLSPAVAFAQTPAPADRPGEGVVMPSGVSFAPADEQQTSARPAPTTTPPPAPRRRPSMVGYVGDASIGSELRVRFDAGSGIEAPDRAEFFYGKCGCYRGLPANHPAYDPDAPGPGPGIATDLNYQQLNIFAEYAMNGRVSVFGDIPVRWLQPQAFAAGFGTFSNGTGFSDIRAGLKAGLVANDRQYLTAQVEFVFPSGDAAKGLGTNHSSFAPTLLYLQRAGDRVTVESQFGVVFPIGGSAGIPTSGSEKFAGTVITYAGGVSVELAPNGRIHFAPVVELFAWHVVNGFQTLTLGPADGTDIANIKIGGRVGTDRQSVYFGYGQAMTEAGWYDKIFRTEFRVGF